MASKDDKGPSGLPNAARHPQSRQMKSASGEPHLGTNDHSILERAIRGSVSNIVGASHPENVSNHHSLDSGGGEDLILYPENHPLARQMPGVEQAIGYRDRLLNSLIDPDPRKHRGVIEELVRAAIPVRTLAVHLFAPVAAQLGNRWCTDETDFMQVAVASTRLGMIVNHVSHAAATSTVNPDTQRRILLARTHGAQHTLGVSIVASCFRDMGWVVDGGSDLEVDEGLYTRLSSQPYDLLGISVGRVDEAKTCSEVVRRVHATPKSRHIKIAIGGPAVIAAPMAFKRIGADFVTRSTLDVMQLASHM